MRIPAAAAVAGLLLVLAGCATAVTPEPRVSIPGLLGAGEPTGSPRPLGGSDVCTAFPMLAVAKASGWRLTAAARATSSAGPVATSECAYDGPDGTLRLLVAPGGGDAALTALIASPDLGGGAIVVTGLGDAAQAALDGIVVRYGDDVVAVIEKPTATPLPLATAQALVVSLRDRLAR